MSRLESAIRRLEAQRDGINWAADRVAGMPGHILELGLGNGRTFDHLRETLPGRDIFVFDRQIAAHPVCVPDEARMFLGDFLDTLPRALARLGRNAILAHSDIGTGDSERSRRLAARIAPLLAPLMLSGGIVLSDQPMETAEWTGLPLPASVPRERYHIYRA
ncbi:MAG: class I SAM-dependent methyltransferase [Pseudomonadota bacterium]